MPNMATVQHQNLCHRCHSSHKCGQPFIFHNYYISICLIHDFKNEDDFLKKYINFTLSHLPSIKWLLIMIMKCTAFLYLLFISMRKIELWNCWQMRHLCWYINLNFDIIQFFLRKLTCLNLLLGIKLVLWRF